LDNIPKVLFNTSAHDRARLWADTAFYNFVQRPMHYDQQGHPERPTWNDFVSAWGIFLQVIWTIRPSHCLFVGVEASKSFDHTMEVSGVPFIGVAWTEKITRTWGRSAQVHIEAATIELAFVQHLGRYFSPSRWHEYLVRQHPGLMQWLAAEHYTATAAPPA
jgi:hypothetical protein